MSRRAWIVAAGIGMTVIATANWPVTTRWGVNYHWTSAKIPLYEKVVNFLSRDRQTRRIAHEIVRGAATDDERLVKIFAWVQEHVQPVPDGFPVVDDHPLNILIRGYGAGDQRTEACMTAIRLARGATGRPKVITFEGCYHGHSDGLLAKRGSGLATLGLSKSAGVPDALTRDTIVVPFNDVRAVEAAFKKFGRDIACVIFEPIAANMGVVPAEEPFQRAIRRLATAHGALVIIDEIVNGFRSPGWFIKPDLFVYGKILGGGLPIGAVAGPKRVMSLLAPEGPVYHAGTFAGHPLAMAAGLATLRQLAADTHALSELMRNGSELVTQLEDAARDAGVPVRINAAPFQVAVTMLTVFFTSRPVRNFADAQATDQRRFAVFANAMRRRGVLIPPSPFEAWFLSTAHTPAIIHRIAAAAHGAFAEVA